MLCNVHSNDRFEKLIRICFVFVFFLRRGSPLLVGIKSEFPLKTDRLPVVYSSGSLLYNALFYLIIITGPGIAKVHEESLPEVIPVSVAWSDLEYFYSPLDGMLVHHRVTLSIKFAGTCTHLCTWVERGNVKVKCLTQEHNTMSPTRAWTRTAPSREECTNHKATLPSTQETYVTWNLPITWSFD